MMTPGSGLNLVRDRHVSLSAAMAVGIAATAGLVDWATWIQLNITIVYGVSLVVAGWSRSRRLLWTLTALLLATTFVVYSRQIPPGVFTLHEPFFVNRVLSAVTLLVLASLVDTRIRATDDFEAQRRALAAKNAELENANAQLEEREQRIGLQNEELERRRRDAEEASSRKTRFLASVSHDIRTPVSALQIMAEVIRRSAEDPTLVAKVPEIARRLQASAHSLADLLSGILDAARLDLGTLELRDTVFSLGELVARKCAEFLPLAEAKALRLWLDPPSPPVIVRADRVQLERVLSNLLGNAVKFTRAGEIRVAVTSDPAGSVRVAIRDTGIGIAPEDQARIFDEFAQVDGMRAVASSWGLGLAICRRLMRMMEGTIEVESEPGRGSVFMLVLPASRVLESP